MKEEAWDVPCTVLQVLRHLGEPWAVSCNGMVMREVVRGLSLVLLVSFHRGWGSCAALDS